MDDRAAPSDDDGRGGDHQERDQRPRGNRSDRIQERLHVRMEVIPDDVQRNDQRHQKRPSGSHTDRVRRPADERASDSERGAKQAHVQQHREEVLPARQRPDWEAAREIEEREQIRPDADEPERRERQADRDILSRRHHAVFRSK